MILKKDAYTFLRKQTGEYMRFCDLTRKEVINVNDCKCLGNVRDLDFDECGGCIKALIVPGPAKWMGCMRKPMRMLMR